MGIQNIISRIDHHADLFEKMMVKLGVRDELTQIDNIGPVYRRAAMRCVGCTGAEECETWLDTNAEPADAPEYCRNRALFARLKAAMPQELK
ncbi:DUF6455 family protein [Hoeflea sp. TYP-13]|uniref:DUF6455 family protein n=1 Tax=Hoeflea sp. TYP-13 TaxID=3230023 RepID=UPI0034C69472